MKKLKEIEIKFNKIQAALDECDKLKLCLPEKYRAFYQELVDNDIKNRIAVAVTNIRIELEGKMEQEIQEAIRLADEKGKVQEA